MRTNINQPHVIRGARGRARPTGGLIDQSLFIDHAAIRRRNAAARASESPAARRAAAELRERHEYAVLVARWEAAERGAPKRAALTELRAHENRHGRMPYSPALALESVRVDVSTGAESWLEVK